MTGKRRTGKNESTKRVDTKGGTAVGSAPPRKSKAALLRGEPKKRSGNGRLTAKTVQNTTAAPQVERGEVEQDGSTAGQPDASGSVFENQIANPKKTDCGNRSQFLRRVPEASRRESIGKEP